MYDSNGILIDSTNITLKVKAKASNPADVVNVLCVGDSLTTNGVWVKEFYRRLSSSGGSPNADGLTNIHFIGTRDKDGAKYEGYGGWTFNSYNTANVSTNSKIITCVGHNKTEADDQHSIYSDSNGNLWKLETIESSQIKIIAITSEGTSFPTSGTLTWVSGGVNHSNITYTASSNSNGNPFWNSVQNKVNFTTYAENLNANSIDYVYVLLGWNSVTTDRTQYKAQAQTFIDNVKASYPNAIIVLIGLEIPSKDGLANNYGSTGVYSDYYGLVLYVFELDEIHNELVSENSNVFSFNLSGQFDTENNMQTNTRIVNVRNSTMEVYQSNGVHPADSGYLQIADACYRDIVHRLQ